MAFAIPLWCIPVPSLNGPIIENHRLITETILTNVTLLNHSEDWDPSSNAVRVRNASLKLVWKVDHASGCCTHSISLTNLTARATVNTISWLGGEIRGWVKSSHSIPQLINTVQNIQIDPMTVWEKAILWSEKNPIVVQIYLVHRLNTYTTKTCRISSPTLPKAL